MCGACVYLHARTCARDLVLASFTRCPCFSLSMDRVSSLPICPGNKVSGNEEKDASRTPLNNLGAFRMRNIFLTRCACFCSRICCKDRLDKQLTLCLTQIHAVRRRLGRLAKSAACSREGRRPCPLCVTNLHAQLPFSWCHV